MGRLDDFSLARSPVEAMACIINPFVAAGSGGLNEADGLVFGPDGNLYVASGLTSQVLRYSGTTGAFIDAFVAAGSGGLSGPSDLVFGPDGNLYVTSLGSAQVLRYNGTTGAFIDAFVAAGSGGLNGPAFLVFSLSSTPVPTLSEWGMILLALSLLTLGTWQVTGRPALLGVVPTAGGALLFIPAQPLLRSVLVGELVAGIGLMLYGRLIAPVAPVLQSVRHRACTAKELPLVGQETTPGRAYSLCPLNDSRSMPSAAT